ncbi:MAG: hypothetical protein ACK5JS_08285 [Mangrovibacterium sp.]
MKLVKSEFKEDIGVFFLEVTGSCGVQETKDLLSDFVEILRARRDEFSKILLWHNDVQMKDTSIEYLELYDVIASNPDVMDGSSVAIVSLDADVVARNVLFRSKVGDKMNIEVFDIVERGYNWLASIPNE